MQRPPEAAALVEVGVDYEGNPGRERGEMVIKEWRYWKTESAQFSSASFSVGFGGGGLILGRVGRQF
jgi:hypothetical protein